MMPLAWHPQYFADQFALFKPRRADYPHLSLLAPQCFTPSGITKKCKKILPNYTLFRSKTATESLKPYTVFVLMYVLGKCLMRFQYAFGPMVNISPLRQKLLKTLQNGLMHQTSLRTGY